MGRARVGMRVLRGPDWMDGDKDGGEGHLGTVVDLLEGHKVRVCWDNGSEASYRTGADGKFDLRLFDSAPVGVRHRGSTCAACEEQNIYGMLWRCKNCRACDLCPLCYVMDKHDLKHEFIRIDEPGSQGEQVKKRSVSLRIRSMGMFPGAKVKRGKNWTWADQDGGPGSVGEVIGFENVAPDSSRNIVRVEWPHGKTNSYRLGFQGNVDLTCVEEEAGTNYYRDHFPVLTTIATSTRSTTSDNSSSFTQSSSSSISSSSPSSSSRQTSFGSPTSGAEESQESFGVGDKVTIQVSEDRLKELQASSGGCTANMLRCIGRAGEVVALAPNGSIGVKFEKLSYRFNPQALTKIPYLSQGDRVQIRSDMEQVKMLNGRRIGWKSGMEQTLGKVGVVTKIDSDGDVVVAFSGAGVAYMYAPACCLPVDSTASLDSLVHDSSSSSDSSASSGSGASSNHSDDYGELHQQMMRMVAQMLGVPGLAGSGGSSGGGDSSSMDKLVKATAKGDTATVRSLCQQDKSLVNRVYKGLTPLIVAAHEGQKDVCSCLLALGADINKEGDKSNTPLAAALEGKEEATALYLLEKGANPRQCNNKQRSPLHLAAYCNLPEAVKVLVQKGADPNVKDQYGDSPLHDAIEKDNKAAVDMLLRVKNIDLQLKNSKGFNMLQLAALRGNAHATERILARDAGQVDKLLDNSFSALHIAANNDHVQCIKLLVKNGNATVNLQGKNKWMPIHMACIKGHIQSLQALLELGATVNDQDSDGDAPLHCTLSIKVDNPGGLMGQMELKQRIRMACILLSKGAYPDLRNKKGQDIMGCCPYSGVCDAIKQFMKQNPGSIKRCPSSTQQGATGGGGVRLGTTGLQGLLQGMAMPCAAASCARMADITLMPCGHKVLCRNHCLKTDECPLCNRTIERRVHKRGDSDMENLADACKQM